MPAIDHAPVVHELSPEPSKVTRHHSGIQPIVVEDDRPEDAILALGREHLEGVRELRSKLAAQQTIAEDLVFEVQRLRRRIAQLEKQLAER